MTPRRRLGRGAIIATAAAVLVLIGAVIALVVWFTARGDSPEAGAQRYLDALASGDADEVRATLTSSALPDAATLEAFGAATAYLSDPEVAGVETSGNDAATVSAAYFLTGGMHAVTFTVRLEDGQWLADADALGSIAATTTMGDAVTIGDVVLEASAPLVALPAVYDVVAAPAGILTGEAEVVVAPGATADVTVEVALAPDASATAQPAVDAYLEACTASSADTPATTSPASCGISIPWGADLARAEGYVFRIETLPTVTLDATGGFIASGGSYVVTVSGQTRAGEPASFTYRDDAWTLRGALTFEGSELILQAW
ncbi:MULTISPECIES: Rv0361 family membrane protein [Bacteria]